MTVLWCRVRCGEFSHREQWPFVGRGVHFATAEEAQQAITDMTRGQGADSAVLTADLVTAEIVAAGFNAIGKGGVVMVTGMGKGLEPTIHLPSTISPRTARV